MDRRKIGHERSWEGRAWVSAHPSLLQDDGLPRIRMITYRCNADFKSLFFTHTVHKSWENRQRVLLAEIASYQADIYCFQDIDHYSDFWFPMLTSLGYSVHFKQRTQEKDYHTEGVAIAYKSSRFQLLKSVMLEFNQSFLTEINEIPISFQEKCRTDDVGMMVFLQPYHIHDLPTGLCIGTFMLDEFLTNHDVRMYHCKYFLKELEKENKNSQYPILLGVNVNDLPLSLPYTLMKTGRKPLTASVPEECTQIRAYPVSRSTALVKWRPPKTTIADPTILYYRICWRPGGSTILSFKAQVEVPSGDCIKYIEVMDEATQKKKIIASLDLECVVTRLSAEIPYEFKVCAVNEMGAGAWSEASDPIVLTNPERAPKMPEIVHFRSLQEVQEQREEYKMHRADFNVHLAYVADPVNTSTQLTPRLIDGSIDYNAERASVLPPYVNPRLGWNPSLGGQPSTVLTQEMNRDYTIHTSLLRNHDGFKETSLNRYQDGFERSPFTTMNDQYEDFRAIPHTGSDGSTVILDAKVVFPHLGKPNERQALSQSFRSAYEGYGVSGEPLTTSSFPTSKGMQSADALDYLFYSQHSGLILHRILTIPNYLMLKHGETPTEMLSKADVTTMTAFPAMKWNFNSRIEALMEKIQQSRSEGEDFSSGNNSNRDNVYQMKRLLKEVLAKSDEMIPVSSLQIPQRPNQSRYSNNNNSQTKQKSVSIVEEEEEEDGEGNQPEAREEVEETKKTQSEEEQQTISNIWGGRWACFTEDNPRRENYDLPNVQYGSSHLAIGAEFLFDTHWLSTNAMV